MARRLYRARGFPGGEERFEVLAEKQVHGALPAFGRAQSARERAALRQPGGSERRARRGGVSLPAPDDLPQGPQTVLDRPQRVAGLVPRGLRLRERGGKTGELRFPGLDLEFGVSRLPRELLFLYARPGDFLVATRKLGGDFRARLL